MNMNIELFRAGKNLRGNRSRPNQKKIKVLKRLFLETLSLPIIVCGGKQAKLRGKEIKMRRFLLEWVIWWIMGNRFSNGIVGTIRGHRYLLICQFHH